MCELIGPLGAHEEHTPRPNFTASRRRIASSPLGLLIHAIQLASPLLPRSLLWVQKLQAVMHPTRNTNSEPERSVCWLDPVPASRSSARRSLQPTQRDPIQSVPVSRADITRSAHTAPHSCEFQRAGSWSGQPP